MELERCGHRRRCHDHDLAHPRPRSFAAFLGDLPSLPSTMFGLACAGVVEGAPVSSSPRSHPHEGGHDPRLQLTGGERDLLDSQVLLRAYLTDVTDDDVLVALLTLSGPARRTLLTPLRLPNLHAKRVGPAVAMHLRRFLSSSHQGQSYGRQLLLLTSPGSLWVSRWVCWPLAELLTVVGGSDRALTRLAAHQPDIAGLHYTLESASDVIRRLGLAAAYAEDQDGAALIVGWLLAEEHVPASVEAALHEVWASVRERLPELPERVRRLTECVRLCDPQLAELLDEDDEVKQDVAVGERSG